MKRKLLGVLTGVFLLLISVQTASAASNYTVSGGEISISAAGVVVSSTATVTEAVIPAKVGDVAVTAIAKDAFKGRSKLTRVVIPDSVKTVGENAFNGCTALTDVTLPAAITLESGAFSWCTAVNHVKFTGTGTMADFTDSYSWTPWYSGCYYGKHDVTVEIASGVTSIGADTFHNAHKIVKATVPESVTKIGASAFEGCSSLGDLDFVQYADEIGAYAFKGCSGAKGAVTVKDGVASIPVEAFRGCSSLQTLTLPASMKKVGADAFNGCSALADVTLPGSMTLESGAFSWCTAVSNVTFLGTGAMSDFTDSYSWTPWYSGCYYGKHDITITVQSGVTAIGAHTFHGSHKIVKATVADTVTKIGASAFEDCSSLGDLDFVRYADEIGAHAFKGCSGATGAVTVKEGVASIPVEAFRGCKSLETLTLPASMKSIGADAFNGCSALKDVTLPGSMTLESGAFSWCTGVSNVVFLGTGAMADFTESYSWTPWYSGCYYGNHELTVTLQSGVTSIGADTFHGSHKIVKATVADTVTKIGASAFESCSSLGDLDFVQYADEIGAYAFKGCSGAKGAVTVKDGVASIPAEAFRGCSSLETLTLPASMKSIGADAFNGCTALKDVTLPGSMTLESGAFSWCTAVSNVVFLGTGDMYDFTESYSWTPWYSGCYYGKHDITITLQSGVTAIGADTFHGSHKIVKATVADTVTKIGASAFEGCSSLGDLDFVRYADTIGAYAFKGCSGAKGTVTVKDGVGEIPVEAFRGCSSLQTLTLPASVKTIKADAFNGCTALENVTFPADAVMESGAFSWCTAVSHVTFLGTGDMSDFTDSYTWSPWYSGCYYGNHDITIDIAPGVKSIGKSTFRGCGKVQSITVPLSVTHIDANALHDCSTLHIYYAGTEAQWGGVTKATTTGASGNTKLYMHYGGAPTLSVTASDGREVLSRTFSTPENAIVFVVGYDSAGQMTETQSKTGGALTFTVSNQKTAKVRVLTFGADYVPLSAPIEAVI